MSAATRGRRGTGRSTTDPEAVAPSLETIAQLEERIPACVACPRLVRWREEVGRLKRRAFRDWTYWARPVPGWGDPRARLVIVGLAPAAHGGNRTGRIFTGDRSGDVLFASLYRCGLAALPTSAAAGDGQRLIGTRMAAAVRCAPPVNKPSVTERDTCAPWLAAEFALLAPFVKVIVCLGGFAWQAAWPMLRSAGFTPPRPRPRFGHGAEVSLAAPAGAAGAAGPVMLLGCYHPSQQNTFTGRVTPAMLDDVFGRARHAAGFGGTAPGTGVPPR
jgi:uracil-DNA glycosylase family 4